MIYFYFGSDTFTLLRELKKLKAQFPGSVEELAIGELSDIDFKNLLSDTLQSQSLFSSKKMVVLKNFLGALNDYSKSEEYLRGLLATSSPAEYGGSLPTPGEGNIVVFTQTEKFDKRLKFFKTLQKSAEIKEFNIPTGHELEKWIEDYLAEAGFKIETDALREFVKLVSGENQEESLHDLWQVSSELDKLMLYRTHPNPLFGKERESDPPLFNQRGGEGGVQEGEMQEQIIGLVDIRSLVRPNISQNVFVLTNLFAEGRSAEAQRLLEQLMSAGPAAELKTQTIQIIGGLASQIRSLLLVKDLEGQTPGKIASTLGWKEGRVWINAKLAQKFTTEKLISLMRNLRALDLRLKTSEEPPKLLLSLFLLKAKV